MNILHMKYAVEVEKTSSITKAAANLYMGQPYLSRCIKELEEAVGIKIFKRTAKGIIPTVDGSEFLEEAKSILVRIENLELAYSKESSNKVSFSISVPRSDYISRAFAKTVSEFGKEKEFSINYKETNTTRAIENILLGNYKLAIIRFEKELYPYVLANLEEKELKYEIIGEFNANILTHESTVFNQKTSEDDLMNGTEICFGDPYVPTLSGKSVKKASNLMHVKNKIMVYERASTAQLLSTIENSYMWVVDYNSKTAKSFGLKILKINPAIKKQYIDILIATKTYRYSSEELSFIANVKKFKNELM